MASKMLDPGVCVLMPTYNNAGTLGDVLDQVLAFADGHVIVVDDGSTDGTPEVLARRSGITVLRHAPNRGKGFSLRAGFEKARSMGYATAITIDSDGQHDPADLPAMVRAVADHPSAMVMGARNMDRPDVPGRSSFGNRFNNFWFKVETGITLPDTQTGYRAWPLEPLRKIRTTSDRFGYEVEAIVKLAWCDVPFHVVPVKVRYDFPERVSHFKPFLDFTRVGLVNTWLVICALAWYWPRKLILRGGLWTLLRSEAVRPDEGSWRKAASIGFGLFMGIVPIWGFQLLIGIPLAVFLRLNRVLFIAAANISIPPMIPLVIYASYRAGEPFMGAHAMHLTSIKGLSLAAIGWNAAQYALGACALAAAMGVAGTLATFLLLRAFRKQKGPA